MRKSITESAAEILSQSLAGRSQEPMQAGGAAITDLGGETPTTAPTAIGAVASAQAKEAPKPGKGGAPAEKTKKKAEKAEVAEETVDEEDGEELTEEDIEEYLNSLTEEELAAFLEEMENLEEESDSDEESLEEEKKDKKDCECDDEDDDEDEDEDEDKDEDKKKAKNEEVELSEEEIAEARKDALKQMVSDNMGSCKEDIDALFSGEELSEEFRTKATTIFEAAVRARVESIVDQVVTENESIMEETALEFQSQLTEQVDDYLNYVVEQWMEENQLAIETGLRVEIAEDFIGGLKNLFVEHYFEVPEEKTDIVEEMAASVVEMEEKLTEQEEILSALQKELNESKAQVALTKICEGLSAVQAGKIKALAEGVEFTTEGEYLQKLSVIRENYFPSNKKKGEVPETLVEVEQAGSSNSIMDQYVKTISKQVQK